MPSQACIKSNGTVGIVSVGVLQRAPTQRTRIFCLFFILMLLFYFSLSVVVSYSYVFCCCLCICGDSNKGRFPYVSTIDYRKNSIRCRVPNHIDNAIDSVDVCVRLLFIFFSACEPMRV